MMGIFDFLNNDDPNQMARNAMMFGLLAGKGNFGQQLGNAGMTAMKVGLIGRKEKQEAALHQQQVRAQALREQLAQLQLQQAQEDSDLRKLPGQFFVPPSTPAIDATGGAETALENPANASAGRFNMPGYINALMARNPVEALKLQEATKKVTPQPFKLGANDRLIEPGTNRVLLGPTVDNSDPSSLSPLGKLIAERDKHPVGSPVYKLYDEWIDAKKREPQGPSPFFQFIPTNFGVLAGNARTGQFSTPQNPAAPGQPIIKTTDDPVTRGRVSAAQQEGQDTGKQIALLPGKEAALSSIKDAKEMLKRGIYAGTYANMKMALAKGTPGISTDVAVNTESFMSYIGQVVIPRLQEFGGNDSNEELRYLQRVMGGEITMEQATLERILDSAEKALVKRVQGLKQRQKPLLPKALPPKNANGWVLQVDANGNKAYVSPDRTQFEEVD